MRFLNKTYSIIENNTTCNKKPATLNASDKMTDVYKPHANSRTFSRFFPTQLCESLLQGESLQCRHNDPSANSQQRRVRSGMEQGSVLCALSERRAALPASPLSLPAAFPRAVGVKAVGANQKKNLGMCLINIVLGSRVRKLSCGLLPTKLLKYKWSTTRTIKSDTSNHSLVATKSGASETDHCQSVKPYFSEHSIFQHSDAKTLTYTLRLRQKMSVKNTQYFTQKKMKPQAGFWRFPEDGIAQLLLTQLIS